ncbi:hypothetical protein PIB30_030912 [Stylosanthes scabra]|uniref:Uncharacterized protein n=1 Tax=Stylosanthes scabra TaxID=79078 RepID=A0ABU6ZA77_9FABA|nr:hypothetical protein [Stylosanthes scabra]
MALNDHSFLTVDVVSFVYILVTGSSPFLVPGVRDVLQVGSTGRFGLDPRHLSVSEPYLGFIPKIFFSFSLYFTMRPLFAGPHAPRPPRPAVSPSSSASSSLSNRVPRERERSPRAPVLVPALALAPVYPPPRVPMMDVRRYRNLFPRRHVTPPTPPPSDDEPSDDDDDEREDSQSASDASLSSRGVSSAGASYGSERESTSFNSGPSDRSSSGSSSGSGSFCYCSGSGTSSSDASSEDNLVDHYFLALSLLPCRSG